ncbi:amidohydrolase family protein [Chryseobacterium sp. 09-1422]|uniref:Amidohydrolase family protein n=1 Tax=Chryseobacterium kimseyorum TaxID=2984028 RepID=A0ABT3HU28_9FLAO|nr:amidohydrolase family protein [Chryseobacterium kimseyorum]MCW3167298.1 amidohydrolase family protein [Chryseobacterium kimseyorum]
MNFIKKLSGILVAATVLFSCSQNKKESSNTENKNILFENVMLIDGNGGQPIQNTKVLVKNGKIAAIGNNISDDSAEKIDLKGKILIPALISAHSHVGTLKGTTTVPENYTEENIRSQLKKYQDYGVLNVMSMGTDRPLLFESGLREKSAKGEIDGARIHSAGYGFGVTDGAPPLDFAMDKVFRPKTVKEIPVHMDSLKKINAELVKIWVDDFNGKFKKKISPEIYKAIITEAHKRDLRVAAHVYYLSDLKQLVKDGIDVIGHSVRSEVIDDATLVQMKAKNIIYIPTLSLDEFAYVYAKKPEWINDEFFKKSLEQGVFEMITSEKYQNELKNSPAFAKNMKAFEIAKQNLKKVFDAGIPVAMGTDSGAMPLRAQGFSEHLELQLMTESGLTPLQAITVATKNSAKALKIDKDFGTIETGKTADFIILNSDPSKNIKNTRDIFLVYKAGKEVSKGPIAK